MNPTTATPKIVLVVGYLWFVLLVLLPLSIAIPPLLVLIPLLPVLYVRRRKQRAPIRAYNAHVQARQAWLDSL